MVLEQATELASEQAEQALVERARRGDRAAFGELVEGSMRRAYRVALGLVGSPEDARDLAAELETQR